MGLFSKIKQGLQKTKNSMMKQVEGILHSFTKIDEELFEELEETPVSYTHLDVYKRQLQDQSAGGHPAEPGRKNRVRAHW